MVVGEFVELEPVGVADSTYMGILRISANARGTLVKMSAIMQG